MNLLPQLGFMKCIQSPGKKRDDQMYRQKVCFVALSAMFLTIGVWAHAGSPASGAQADASNKKTSQKKGTNASSQGGSVTPTRRGQSATSPRDPASGLPVGRQMHKPIIVDTNKSSVAVVTTKPTDQASPKLAVTKPTDKSSPGLLKQRSATLISASPTPTPAIKKGTTSKR